MNAEVGRERITNWGAAAAPTPLAVLSLESHSAEETQVLGRRLAAALQPGQVIALQGTLVQGIAAALGINGRVTSPTFTLVNEYRSPAGFRLIHADTYRLDENSEFARLEAETFGLDETLDSQRDVILVEWAERIASLLPADHLRIQLEPGSEPEDRLITLSAFGPRSAAVLAALTAFPQ
jgi:tRNA threonylcarbamoyladenosine biosynthesis protein TsaE